MGPTAKAVIELLARTDRKGGRLLGVKGAEARIIRACFFQLDMLANDLNYIHATQ
jgi:hypothetical protein